MFEAVEPTDQSGLSFGQRVSSKLGTLRYIHGRALNQHNHFYHLYGGLAWPMIESFLLARRLPPPPLPPLPLPPPLLLLLLLLILLLLPHYYDYCYLNIDQLNLVALGLTLSMMIALLSLSLSLSLSFLQVLVLLRFSTSRMTLAASHQIEHQQPAAGGEPLHCSHGLPRYTLLMMATRALPWSERRGRDSACSHCDEHVAMLTSCCLLPHPSSPPRHRISSAV